MLTPRLAALAATLALAGSTLACASQGLVGRTPDGAPVSKLQLSMSNAYVIRGPKPVLIDAGTYGDMDELERQLADAGVAPRSIKLVIVTHAHHDHAGLAADLRDRYHARILLGAGDVTQAGAGLDDELRPTGLSGWVLKPLLPKIFPEFVPDLVVTEPVDLAPWGISGKVLAMPGHTPGSLVVLLSDGSAFVGDEILGGFMGGLVFPGSPGEHYFHADPAQNRRNVARLLQMGVQTFYLGHGGPVSRKDVMRVFGDGG